MDDMLENIQPTLVVEESVSLDSEPVVVELSDEWEEMPAPEEAETIEESSEVKQSLPLQEDRADLEAELARLDAERQLRTPGKQEAKADPRLDALHDQLSELDF